MKITDDTIDKLAYLARLEFTGEKKEKIKEDLDRILAFCEKLNEVDTEGVEPLIFMTDEVNVLREDVVKPGVTREEALKNAPSRDSDYFKVAKVLEKGN